MSNIAIKITGLGKAYRLYSRQMDRILDSIGINRLLFYKKNYYQEFWALRDINLIIERGERVGIVGRNGAGKSTLLKIIAGNITPTEGKITVNGRVDALMELGTGFHPEFTGRQNINASLGLYGLTYKEIKRLEEEIIDFAELEEFIDYPVRTYSAGMYARLAFSVSTMLKPDILIIDEILGAGDAYFAGKCIERMKRLTEDSGATVLFVSHDVSSIQGLCERAVFIERGNIVDDGDTLPVIKKYTALIREMENERIRLKSLGLRRKDAAIINTEYGRNSLLFHLIEEGSGNIKNRYPITRIVLSIDDKYSDCLNVGQPMDNDVSHTSYLITSPGYTEWSNPHRENGMLFRYVKDCGGIYQHAPFIFKFPDLESFQNVRLLIEYFDNTDGRLLLELYNGRNYVTVGEILFGNSNQIKSSEFDITALIKDLRSESKLSERVEDKSPSNHLIVKGDVYGEITDLIEKVQILDSDEIERYVFITREKMIIRIFYNAKGATIENPVFVVAIYRSDGSVVNQAISSKDGITIPTISGRGYVDVIYDPLIIGEGDYAISVGIFKYVNLLSREESPSYCVHDRRYLLKVKQHYDIKISLGIVNQDIKWEVKSGI